jgi:hypothetical protein
MSIIIAILVVVITLQALFIYNVKKEKKENSTLEILKNALLSFSLMQTCDNIDHSLNLNYASYDGTKLPSFSGYNIENACFSYITKNNFTKQMDDKSKAIEKYLAKNFDSQEQVVKFFEKFVKSYKKE